MHQRPPSRQSENSALESYSACNLECFIFGVYDNDYVPMVDLVRMRKVASVCVHMRSALYLLLQPRPRALRWWVPWDSGVCVTPLKGTAPFIIIGCIPLDQSNC